MPSSLFQRLKLRQKVAASYDVQSSISIYCMLDILDVDSHCERFEASIGMRALADTSLPVGSRLTIKLADLGVEDRQGIYYTAIVDAVRKKAGVSVHSIQVKEKIVPQYHRAHARVELQTDAVRGGDIQFRTSNISPGGLQLTYGAKLTSAVLNRAMSVNLNLEGILLSVECIPRYIQYNWWAREHTVGTAFANLPQEHVDIINTYIDDHLPPDERSPKPIDEDEAAPEPSPEKLPTLSVVPEPAEEDKNKQKITMIDAESGRIRFK